MPPKTKIFALSALLLCLCLFGMAPARADGRYALVIGNGEYKNVGGLSNAAADARSIAAVLTRIGFTVALHTDLDRQGMVKALRDFGEKSRGAELTLFYYAGHGLQVARSSDAENYLVPVDAKLKDVRDADEEALSVNRALEWLDGSPTRIVILDACRDNPFSAQMRGQASTRSLSRGLARVDSASQGTLLVYSTEPGNVALDGDGKNSPFATALIENLPVGGMEIRQMLTRVRQNVYASTAGRQTPWSSDGLFRDVYLVDAPATASGDAPPRAAAQPDDAFELTFWSSVAGSGDPRELEAYLTQFPNGRFAGLARARLERLKAGATVASVDRSAPSTNDSDEPPAPKSAAPIIDSLATAGPLDRAGLMEAQRLLNGMGFDTGTPDGMPGQRTAEATAAFLKSVGRDAMDLPNQGVLELLKQPPPPVEDRAAALQELGEKALLGRENASAKRLLTAAVRLAPASAQTQLSYGDALRANREYPAAKAAYEQARDLDKGETAKLAVARLASLETERTTAARPAPASRPARQQAQQDNGNNGNYPRYGSYPLSNYGYSGGGAAVGPSGGGGGGRGSGYGGGGRSGGGVERYMSNPMGFGR